MIFFTVIDLTSGMDIWQWKHYESSWIERLRKALGNTSIKEVLLIRLIFLGMIFLVIMLHLEQATEQLPESRLLELDAECLRINRMSTLAGQAALESMVINWASYSLLEDQYERSCWVFLNETDAFAQAESPAIPAE